MLSENIILQSAGSLSVAVLALLMVILQALFFFRKPEFTWYAWSSAISFSALIYSLGIFLEYNTPEGPLNRFSGLLEYTAIIFLVHSLYGFTFSYLGIESKRYHPVAGVCHGLILILLWFTNYIVAESFTSRNFIGLEFPYIEPALGPLGPVFVLYAAIAGVNAMIIWIKHKRTDPKHRITYLAGMGFWYLLGIHDALASLGVPTFQYVMEYGFMGFAMVVLWVVFNNYLEIAAVEKYRVMTEFANDCILVIQDGKMVSGNPACCDLIGWSLTDSGPRDFLDVMASEDRKTVLEHYNTLLEGGSVPNPDTVRIRRTDGEQRFVEITTSVIRYRNRPAVLAVMRDMEEALREIENKYRTLVDRMNDGLAVFDSTDLNTFVNDKVCRMLGYSRDEFSGHPAGDFLDEANQRILEEHIARRRKGECDPYELEWTHKNGQKVFTLVSPTLILDADGRYAGAFAVITDITERRKRTYDLEERVKELNCLYGISKVVEQQDISLEETLQGTVNLIPASWRYPEITCARVILEDQVFVTDKFNESVWKQGGDIIVNGERAGALEVFYLEERPEIYEGPFLKEERYLIDAIAERLGKIIQQKRTEEALQKSEVQKKAILDASIDVIRLVDKEMRIIWINKTTTTELKTAPEQLVGSFCYEAVAGRDTPCPGCPTKKALKSGKAEHALIHQKELKGIKEETYWDDYAVPIKNESGDIVNIIQISRNITENKQAEEALRRSNEEVLKEHNQRKMLSKRLIDLLEKDRRQIAMELHDHIGQTLTSIKMNLEMIHGKLKPGRTELGDQITVVQERTIQAIKDVKNVSHGLRPAMIDALGVVSSLRELFNETQQQTDMEIHFFSRGIPERFEEEKELAIYRIAQEALNNIIRHARAKNVFMNLVKKDENLSLSVEDDGVGFDQDKLIEPSKKKGPLGLIIMRERAVQLDGEFTIESQIGKGTHLLVEIPL